MIDNNAISWKRLLFTLKGSSLAKTWPRILTATFIAVVVTIADRYSDIEKYTLTTTPFTLIGVALGVFLGFRNNAAYDRFWEGRKLWGALVNTSRSITRQAYVLCESDSPDAELVAWRARLAKRTIAFVHAFKNHLRDQDGLDEIAMFLPADDFQEIQSKTHRPVALLQQLGRDITHARQRGWLHVLNMPAMEQQLVGLTDILGGCERIKKTPIPFPYTVLSHRTVALFCFAAPLGLIDTIGVLTPVVVFLISQAFFGLDDLGDEIAEPFGTELNNLPLESISRTIEINLLEMIGEPCQREAPAAHRGVLS